MNANPHSESERFLRVHRANSPDMLSAEHHREWLAIRSRETAIETAKRLAQQVRLTKISKTGLARAWLAAQRRRRDRKERLRRMLEHDQFRSRAEMCSELKCGRTTLHDLMREIRAEGGMPAPDNVLHCPTCSQVVPPGLTITGILTEPTANG